MSNTPNYLKIPANLLFFSSAASLMIIIALLLQSGTNVGFTIILQFIGPYLLGILASLLLLNGHPNGYLCAVIFFLLLLSNILSYLTIIDFFILKLLNIIEAFLLIYLIFSKKVRRYLF